MVKFISKIKEWIYHHISYDCYEYKTGEIVLTKTFVFLGDRCQKEIKDGSEEEYFTHMSGQVVWHENCE